MWKYGSVQPDPIDLNSFLTCNPINPIRTRPDLTSACFPCLEKMRIPNSEYFHFIMRFSFPKEKYVVINDFFGMYSSTRLYSPKQVTKCPYASCFFIFGWICIFPFIVRECRKFFVYFRIRSYFFYFTQFLKNTCIWLSILHSILIKYSFFIFFFTILIVGERKNRKVREINKILICTWTVAVSTPSRSEFEIVASMDIQWNAKTRIEKFGQWEIGNTAYVHFLF